jgi:hypothetical protein
MRARHLLRHTLGEDLPACLVGTQDRFQPPVLDFQDQQAAPRVQDHEVRVGVPRADGHVVPDQVVVVELLLQPFGGAPLAAVMRPTQVLRAG